MSSTAKTPLPTARKLSRGQVSSLQQGGGLAGDFCYSFDVER